MFGFKMVSHIIGDDSWLSPKVVRLKLVEIWTRLLPTQGICQLGSWSILTSAKHSIPPCDAAVGPRQNPWNHQDADIFRKKSHQADTIWQIGVAQGSWPCQHATRLTINLPIDLADGQGRGSKRQIPLLFLLFPISTLRPPPKKKTDPPCNNILTKKVVGIEFIFLLLLQGFLVRFRNMT